MTNRTIPTGQRFSHVYVARGEPTSDSVRMRRRLSGLMFEMKTRGDLGGFLERELGVSLPYNGYYDWHKFFASALLRDVLDTITIFMHFAQRKNSDDLYKWIGEVPRVLAEENVTYVLDKEGGVHYSIDAEFNRNQAATLAVLSMKRYAGVLHAFEAAFPALDMTPPDGKTAVRQIFFATENLFKLMFPAQGLLGANTAERELNKQVDGLYKNDQAARAASNRMIASFKDWITAAHSYRHEPGEKEPVQPPLSLALLLVSQGASYIRWLAELDQATLSA
jgi:hypothetical protein